ncbi:hypothetical protein P152DRAFT_483611 [Eremomyces bilateralis CBS 781.70]|uniref:E3 ubiquitin-protein ligase n=1 Tax=Eremomyces bilateralis CBS 781.70 TaxID=1392243 RepID=A0A6G1FZC3_9PEZI|nr:uncharacterized protein P152DRAFT_483611 [Eremomyces bilateralis CBS 781.70]KAF1810909.1 hypothetical protein P152DRAFT_483611 [Eremomyces bilateralis CBS 781.70]
MSSSDAENRLYRSLGQLPAAHDNRYCESATQQLLEILFRSLAGDDPNYLGYFFPPTSNPAALKWSLRAAQGAVEGAEYTEAARGTACGHIFKAGEASYRCKTCTNDDTCVLCAKCFEASDHEGHIVYVSISPGNSGCCDCGDDEAWIHAPLCNIHSPLPNSAPGAKAAGKAKESSDLPPSVVEGIRRTIAIAFDYLCDVFSCSPEQLRLPKTLETVQTDEVQSRLSSRWFPDVPGWSPSYEACNEFALVLWNDEKHTVEDVKEQVARACKVSKKISYEKALEIDDVGRSVIIHSYELKDLLRMASIIEEIKLTVTVRSARDTFREQMCEFIIKWICDIAGCSAGNDAHILRNTICEELLKPWRTGSKAHHAYIGKDGIDDHASEDNLEEELRGGYASRARIVRMAQQLTRTGQGHVIQIAGGAQIILGEAHGLLEELEAENEDRMDVDQADTGERESDIDVDTSDGLEDPSRTVGPVDSVVHPARRGSALPSMTPNPRRGRTSSVPMPLDVPKTPRPVHASGGKPMPPSYWLEKPAGYGRQPEVPIEEDLWQRVRLDYLILYDLRMWKNCRIDVRDVFISTVVTLPYFKRLMGLRFAGLYTLLAQLYLIADREPDHSIINLSLQMLTTPSITAEIVDRGNFLSNLMAILYTFITTRQVGYPSDVDPNAILSLEQGTVTNRRIYHFFMDMKYMMNSSLVQSLIRDNPQYLLQFLDLVKLHQGIVPNVRALGEHVEFEPETWISASIITREMNRLCRQFAESFCWRPGGDKGPIRRAIRETAKVVIINSIGAERARFVQSEITSPVRFDVFPLSEFHLQYDSDNPVGFRVVQYDVGKEPMSFHHALHYTFSWLVDRAKCMDNEEFRAWIDFTAQDLRAAPSPPNANIPDFVPHDYLLAMFDFPLRVCAWLAQMKANMWVRNGVTLRHQMQTYRGHTQRDLAYLRDIFLLQLALVVCDPQMFLATMVDRFDLRDWAMGNFGTIKPDRDELQMLEMAEEFVHLLIVLLIERTFLLPIENPKESHVMGMRRDIAHILLFRPLSHSDITQRMSEKVQDSDELADLLDQMTQYKAPEGVSDVGTFELKKEFIAKIDPYIPQYTRNQREEAENIYKRYMAEKTGTPVEEVVYEPNLLPLESGIFKNLAHFTKTPIFIQIIFYFLELSLVYKVEMTNISAAKMEVFLQFVLTLILIAVNEDHDGNGFVVPALYAYSEYSDYRPDTKIISALQSILASKRYEACAPKIRLILKRMKEKKPEEYAECLESLGLSSPLLDPSELHQNSGEADKELKKKQALERQAKIMAQFKQQQNSFVQNQTFDWGEEDFSDLDDDFEKVEAEETEEVRKFPTGTCIMCQEETNSDRLYGTFSFISESSILRQTPALDMDWIEEVRDTPISLDRSAESIRPFGVAGKNRRTVEKFDADGNVTITERQELAKGFPSNYTRRGPVATGCGHLMHWTCFEDYFQATHRRHLSQVARLHPERLDLGEFECPLCKALGNAFLPIIWKAQKVTQVGQDSTDLNDWVVNALPQYLARGFREEETTLTKKLDTVSKALQQEDTFIKYGSQEFAGPVSSRLADYSTYTGPIVQQIALPDPTTGQLSHAFHILSPTPSGPLDALRSVPVYPLLELNRAYIRLNTTLRLNNIPSRYALHSMRPTEALPNTDALMRAVGFSISAAEIAQRGVESSPGATLLEKVPEQTLIHLRIVSETVKSYISLGCIRSETSPITSKEYTQTVFRQLQLLFPARPELGNDVPATRGLDTLLGQDPFIFLTECAFGIVPALNIDLRVVMRLCYLAEMVRVILAFMHRTVLPKHHVQFSDSQRWTKQPTRPAEARSFLKFYKIVSKALFPTGPAPSDWDLSSVEGMTPFIYSMMATYMLPFLRKCMILMNVKFATEFPIVDSGADEPELTRLERALNFPSMYEITLDVIGNSENPTHSDEPLYGIVRSWIKHYHEEWADKVIPVAPAPYPKPSPVILAHPAIFELIGLPRIYDTLTVEAFKRNCPTTGRYMTDPVVCLLCGEIFCSQAVCCLSERKPGSRERRGGCNQHQIKCGGTTGMYINIRKGMVILLSTQPEQQGMSMGSWANAPYLDKHGEADPTLRRHHQLFLNQKRYDVLFRQLWLNHGIASAIARKLDSENSNGGWETT